MRVYHLTEQYDNIQVEINQKKSEIESLQKQIKKLEDEIHNSPQTWVDIILVPLARRIADKINLSYLEVRGSGATMTVFFAKSEDDLDNTLITITFKFKPSILLVIHEGKIINVSQMTVDQLIKRLNLIQ